MALEATFDDLGLRLRAAHEALLELRVTVVEDKPLRGEAALVDDWGDAVEDLAGTARGGGRARGRGAAGRRPPPRPRPGAAIPLGLPRAGRPGRAGVLVRPRLV